MNCKNILYNILFSLLYLYGFFWILISILPKFHKNLMENNILKKEISIEILMSMCLINMLFGAFYFFEKIFDRDQRFDNCKVNELKHIRQFYLIIGLYVIVIHIEYTTWILVFGVFYLYANIWIFFSEIIYKKEFESYYNNHTQSMPVQIDIESSTTQIIGTPISYQPYNQL